MCNRRRRQQGVTIVELIMFIVIVGVAAAGILQVMDLTNRTSTDPIRRKQAMLIAEAYMEELQQAQFTFCDAGDDAASSANSATDCTVAEKYGPELGNARPFDNINDYVPANYVEGTPVRAFAVAGPNNTLIDTDVAGNPLGAGLGNTTLNSFVTTLALTSSVQLGDIAGSKPDDMTVLQITITVTYGAGESIVLQGYRTRYQPKAI